MKAGYQIYVKGMKHIRATSRNVLEVIQNGTYKVMLLQF